MDIKEKISQIINGLEGNLIFYLLFVLVLHIAFFVVSVHIYKNSQDSVTLLEFTNTAQKKQKLIEFKIKKRYYNPRKDDITELERRIKKRKKRIKQSVPKEPEKLKVRDVSLRNKYILKVYKIINENKYYPRLSQERGEEGLVSVTFTIIRGGNIKNLRIMKKCPFKYLNLAAMKTVRDSVPLPVPPHTMDSINVILDIQYRLDDS